MDGYQIFNWGLLFITFGLMIYLGYLSSKMMEKDDEGGFLLAGRSLGAMGAALAIPGRLRMFDWLKRYRECGNPCQRCFHECPVEHLSVSVILTDALHRPRW